MCSAAATSNDARNTIETGRVIKVPQRDNETMAIIQSSIPGTGDLVDFNVVLRIPVNEIKGYE